VPSYPVLEVSGSEKDLELALALFLDHGCLGTEDLPAGTGLRLFFPDGVELEPLRDLLARTLPRLVSRTAPPVALEDWLSQWKKSFTGFALGESVFVLPTWKEAPDVSRSILRIDPEQAFGTGTHDTTRMSATLLERFVRSGSRVIDAGSGTGILAMVAARLGAGSVVAFEPDPDAVRCARENFERNGLSERIELVPRPIEDAGVLEADLIVANIVRPVLEEAIERMRAPLVILSGLLAEESDPFVSRLPPRLGAREIWTAGDWSTLVLAPRP
jgi:ribosomal protein L11 methyltransferase